MTGFTPDPALLAWIVLRRVRAGGVTCVAGCWVDGGHPVPGFLADALNQTVRTGLVVLAEDGPYGPLRRASLTDAGHTQHDTLNQRHAAPLTRTGLQVPAAQFGTAQCPPSSGHPDRLDSPRSGRPVLHWARDPDDALMHVLASIDVRRAESCGYAECLCGHQLPAAVVLEANPTAPLCLPCSIGAADDLRQQFGDWETHNTPAGRRFEPEAHRKPLPSEDSRRPVGP